MLKRILTTLLCTAFVSSTITTLAFASGVSYNPTNGIITVKGEANGYVSITALPGNLLEYDTTRDIVAFETISADGAWSVQLALDDSCEAGMYTVFVSTADNPNEALSFNYTPKGSSSSDATTDELKSSVYAKLKGASTTDAYELLQVNADLLGIDDSFFNDARLSEVAKAKMLSVLTNANSVESLVNAEGDINKLLDKAKLFGAITSAKTTTDVKTILTSTFADESAYLMANCPYFKDSLANKIYEKFASYRTKLTTVTDLQKYFDQAAKEVSTSQSQPTSTNGGGGGGGGGGGASASTSTSTTTKLSNTEIAKWLLEPFQVTDRTASIEVIKAFIQTN